MGVFDHFSKPPTKDKFTKMLMDGIRRAGETTKIVYDSGKFSLTRENKGLLNLHNAYAEYCNAAKEDQQKVLQKWIRAWFLTEKDIPEDYEDVCHDLLPAVRGRAYFEVTRLGLELENNATVAWPYQPIGEHLGVGLVYDMREAMRMIRQEDLDKWGVTFYEAMEVATENLKQLQHAFIGPEEGEGVYLSANHDSYDACRLLLLDAIRQMRVKGDVVAMAPTRDTLIVTGSEDAEGLKGLLALAKDAVKQTGFVSTVALRLDGEEWLPWLPEPQHSLFSDFKLMQAQAIGDAYGQQKNLLDRLHEKEGKDVFVATYNAVRSEQTGAVRTYTIRPGTVFSWLPCADIIAFMRTPNDKPRLYGWEQAARVVRDMMEPLGMYPERFQVNEFPAEEQFQAMGEEQAL